MIGGMAHAARVFGRDDWLASARRALDFVRATMWTDDRLLATHKDGKTHLNAYLDDYAFLLAAAPRDAAGGFPAPTDLAWAEALGDALLESFHDVAGGGFFFTSHDHERLIHRPKPGHDNATPSGNGVAAWALNRLAFLSGETRFRAGRRGHAGPLLARHRAQPRRASGACSRRWRRRSGRPTTVIVNGPPAAFGPWREALRRDYLPAHAGPVRAGTRPACPPRSPSPPARRSTPGCARALHVWPPSPSRGNCAKR